MLHVGQLISTVGAFLIRCICRNYGRTQYIFLKSNLHCSRFIKLAVVPKRGHEWRGPTPRQLAPVQHSSEETSQRWRAVGYFVSDLTGQGIEPQTFGIDSDIFNTAL